MANPNVCGSCKQECKQVAGYIGDIIVGEIPFCDSCLYKIESDTTHPWIDEREQ